MKRRIDVLLTERGLAESREKSKALVISGNVTANGRPVKNPSETFEDDCEIKLKNKGLSYVSRGALKLEKAVETFGITLENKICADIGASTGGFTDYMLKDGANRVYAIDVGRGQLDWRLRNDSRVINMERTNARYLKSIPETPQFVSIDVAFISLSLIFPAITNISADDTVIVALIKPQFEAGREKVGKKGVIKNKETHIEVIENVVGAAAVNGLSVTDLTFSPIKGPMGNIEYLAYILCGTHPQVDKKKIENIVDDAHLNLA